MQPSTKFIITALLFSNFYFYVYASSNDTKLTKPSTLSSVIFKSKLNAPCNPLIFKNFSMFELLNEAVSQGKKIKDKESLNTALIKIRKKVDNAKAEDIEQSCATKGEKVELLECINQGGARGVGICNCFLSGIWGALQLQVENGECVSPNGAWCINWGNDVKMQLTKCAGLGICSPPKSKLPFLCAELQMGVCENGVGAIATMKRADQPSCFLAKATSLQSDIITFKKIIVLCLVIVFGVYNNN